MIPTLMSFFFLMIPRPPISTLFPYTTLFRSQRVDEPLRKLHTASRGEQYFCALASKAYQRDLVTMKICLLKHTRERRSEEHTSELQSQSNLVCRLLLEKKKKKKKKTTQ